MKFGSLFSGIGGFDLGLERAGMECAWQVEIDDYCQRVLAKHWPDVPRYGDIKELDPNDLEPVDLICGGFPCQPVSLAGKRLAQEDPRWLWPEFFRIVRVLRPRYVLVENVPGLASAGMGDVLGDLAAGGYDTEWDCIPAAAVGAPHLRYRIWIVAHATSDIRGASGDDRSQPFDGGDSFLADPDSGGRRQNRVGRRLAAVDGGRPDDSWPTPGSGNGRPGRQGRPEHGGQRIREQAYPLANAEGQHVGRLDDGESEAIGAATSGHERSGDSLRFDDWWTTEPDVGRVAHGVPARVDRLRGLGNAVVPQVAEWIGRRIVEAS